MYELKTIHQNQKWKIQAVLIPNHKRCIQFKNKQESLNIPNSIAAAYIKPNQLIHLPLIINQNLEHFVDFGNNVCTNGLKFQSLVDYVNWYWNTQFLKKRCHTKIKINDLRLCKNDNILHHLANHFNPNKLEIWKKYDKKHLQLCNICNENHRHQCP